MSDQLGVTFLTAPARPRRPLPLAEQTGPTGRARQLTSRPAGSPATSQSGADTTESYRRASNPHKTQDQLTPEQRSTALLAPDASCMEDRCSEKGWDGQEGSSGGGFAPLPAAHLLLGGQFPTGHGPVPILGRGWGPWL